MAGEYTCTGVLRSRHFDIIATNGFNLNVLLDVSHNAHFQTVSVDRPHDPVIAKKIELDCQLTRGTGTVNYAGFITACNAERVSSPLYHFGRHMLGEAQMARITPAAHLEAVITLRAIKIEFPQFDDSIAAIDFLVPGTPAGNAILAATTDDMDVFDALHVTVRSSMGMYQRNSSTSFTATPGGDTSARTAYRG